MAIGIIYFVQPTQLIGTRRYKLGCSKNTALKRIMCGYDNGSRYILIMETDFPFILEKIIKTKFAEKFKLIAGHEYFEGDEESMIREFFELTIKHRNNIKNGVYNNISQNNKIIKVNDYPKKSIIRKNILIKNSISRCDYYKYDMIQKLFFYLIFNDEKNDSESYNPQQKYKIIKCTNEKYDNIMNNMCDDYYEHKNLEIPEDNAFGGCNLREYLLKHKEIIIKILNKNIEENSSQSIDYISDNSLYNFLGYYDNNFSFLTTKHISEYIETIKSHCYYELIKEHGNNKYSGFVIPKMETKKDFSCKIGTELYLYDPSSFLIIPVSNVDLDYDHINRDHGGDFYGDPQKYINECLPITTTFEKIINICVSFKNVSDYSTSGIDPPDYESSEITKILCQEIIKESIQKKFSNKITDILKNRKLDTREFNEIPHKKYKNFVSFIKSTLGQ